MPESQPRPEAVCPACGSKRCSRIHRKGLIQQYILPYFGRFPWECGDCRKIFLLQSRGKLKRRRKSTGSLRHEDL